MIPHKYRIFRLILDLSLSLRLKNGELLPLVNEPCVKTAARRGINQLEHVLMPMIPAFAQADEYMKSFIAKWDIKDGSWRLNCVLGKEWNFA